MLTPESITISGPLNGNSVTTAAWAWEALAKSFGPKRRDAGTGQLKTDDSLGRVRKGTMPLLRSNLEHGNVLPQYRWMCKESGAEFAESGYCKVTNGAPGTPGGYSHQGPLPPPCSVAEDPACPDSVFIGLFQDERTMTLPYTVQDVYDRAQTPSTEQVLVLENDELAATVTPQWGGRLWSLRSKRTGKELFYRNMYFQPTNDALRQAYIQGGSEWNFGPQIGHASDSVTPVYAAQLPTERGDILRVYAMERTTSAVWQVDMLLGNSSVCWVHIKLTNAQPEETLGYWWTNVAVHSDSDGSKHTRILTPASHWIADGGIPSAHPPWPFFHERGGAVMTGAWSYAASNGDWTHPDYAPRYGAPADHSYPFV